LLTALWDHWSLVEEWEHIADRHTPNGRKGEDEIRRFASVGPISLHSLDLSVGSRPEGPEQAEHVAAMAKIVRAAGVDEVSDHLGFSRFRGRSLGHFAPLWRVEEQVQIVVDNVDRLQHQLGCRLVLETIAMDFDPGGDLTTAELLNEVTQRTGCGVLLDISNLYVNHHNGIEDLDLLLETLDLTAVREIHLGGSTVDADGRAADAHAYPIPPAEIDLVRELVPRMANLRSVSLERDGRMDDADEIVADLQAIHAAIAAALEPVAV
jgi:uncharacterized protein (UPF0276 family)